MRRKLRRKNPALMAWLVYVTAKVLARTLRWRVSGLANVEEAGTGVLLCIWHGRTFIPSNYMRHRGIWALFSLSTDGEVQSRIFSHLGYRVIRGSTGRGGERALIEAIRVLRKGDILAITPDGPRGPAGEVQGGMLMMAKKSGAALVPLGTSARRRWLLGTWDSYLIPKPFTKVSIRFGEPVWISSDASEAELERVRQKLKESMDRLQDEADQEVGLPLRGRKADAPVMPNQ